MDTEEHLVYKKILKATSLFGGVQGISIFSSIIKSKFLAILIGTSGYGIYGFLITIIDLFKQVSGLGIETSGVKLIAENAENELELTNKISVLYKLSFVLGCLGVLAAICFAPFLSWIVFSDTSKWFVFVFISLSILFNQLVATNNAIFQGSDKVSFLAKSNLYSNLVGLFITIPLFYFFRTDAIIPSILCVSLINFLISTYYLSKIIRVKKTISVAQSFSEGKDIIRFGSLFVLLGFLPLVVNFALQFIINIKEGIQTVGLFNVAIIVLNTYVGFVFSIMATEYYPRLVKSFASEDSISKIVAQQITISLLLVVPLVLFFNLFGHYLINLLFSDKFVAITKMLNWALYGMVFKAISFPIGYIFIAKTDSKIFTKTSIIFNCLYFLMLYFGFSFYGLEGLGVAILVYYIIHLLVIYIIANKRYQLTFDSRLMYLIVVLLIVSLLFLIIKMLVIDNFSYLLLLFLITLIFSIYKFKSLLSNGNFNNKEVI